jgi:hypothetical protein
LRARRPICKSIFAKDPVREMIANLTLVCFGFDNEPSNLKANDYLLGPKGDDACGVYGAPYQLVNPLARRGRRPLPKGAQIDPWFSRNPQWMVNVVRGRETVQEPKIFCKNPSPGYRAILGINPFALPQAIPNPRWETADSFQQ